MSPPSTSWSKLAQTEIIEVSLVVLLLRKGPQPTVSIVWLPQHFSIKPYYVIFIWISAKLWSLFLDNGGVSGRVSEWVDAIKISSIWCQRQGKRRGIICANVKICKIMSYLSWIGSLSKSNIFLQMSLLGQALCTMGEILSTEDQKLLLTLT